MSPELKLIEEAEFANLEYAKCSENVTEISKRMFSKYSSPVHMWDWRQKSATLLGDISGATLLDYGCGMGEEAAYFALLGAKVTAIDISEVGVGLTKERARHNGLCDRVNAIVMNATPTDFEPGCFDIIHGLGILHHVGLKPGLDEVYRLLRPGGRAVFLEPMGNSRSVESCKRFVHTLLGKRLNLIPVTSGEENLRLSEIRNEASRFRRTDVYPYHLTYRVRKLILPHKWYDASLIFDFHVLRTLPFLKYFAGAVVLYFEK